MAETRHRFAYFLTATTALVAIAAGAASPAFAQSNDPIKIGVIAEVQSIAGAATPGGAQIAAEEINAKGGINGRKIEIVSYDNKSSSADSVRAFQRAVSDDKVSAVIASYISEVVLALEPWAARLQMPLITPGAASNEITRPVHDDYDKNKYTFHGYLTSAAQAQAVCDAAKDLLVDGMKMKTAAIMSEDAAWTKPLDAGYEACLPKAGLKVRRSRPLLARHHRLHADLQQARGQEAGRDRHRHLACRRAADRAVEEPAGADPDVRHQRAGAEPDLLGGYQRCRPRAFRRSRSRPRPTAVTPKTKPFATAFKAKFGTTPAYTGYTAYDEVYIIADAIKRAGLDRSRQDGRRTGEDRLRRHHRPGPVLRHATTSSPTASSTVRTMSAA